MCPKCKSNNIAGNHRQLECCECGELWSPLDEELDEKREQELQRLAQFDVFNPIPRFERINQGICPDCDGQLTDNGSCIDCHITPALDPDYQEWLKAQPETKLCLKEDSTTDNWQPLFSKGFM